jgi:hypothetical protein
MTEALKAAGKVSRLPVSYRLRPEDGGAGREDAKGASGWAYSAR